MRKMKNKHTIAISLLIVGLVLTSASSALGAQQETKQPLLRKANVTASQITVERSAVYNLERSAAQMLASTMIIDTDYDDFHPTISGDTNGQFFAGFELSTDGIDYYPDFWYSLDGGMTWEEAGYFAESLGAEFPDTDSNDNGFYFTFGAPTDNPGQQWLGIAEDLTAITASVWDWGTYGIEYFEHLAISCYTRDGELWNPGGMSGTGYNGYSGADQEGAPFVFYPNSDTGGAIGWLNSLENYTKSDFAIDEITEDSYAVYQNEYEPDILVRKDDFGSWNAQGFHPYLNSYFVGDGVNPITSPSVDAANNVVVIAAEREGNIYAFYSSNGFTTVNEALVVESAVAPEVKVTLDGSTFVCSYVKSDAVYRKISTDGGASWTDEQMVEDSQTNAEYGSHDLGTAPKGVFSVWEDTRNADIDIFFGEAYVVSAPELEISSISGPIGVKAAIKNIGDAAATNVQWTIEVTGGALGRIDKSATGTIASLAIGATGQASLGLIIGLGKITVTVSATCDEGVSAEETVSGTQLLILTLL
jgi:hypothetical protein